MHVVGVSIEVIDVNERITCRFLEKRFFLDFAFDIVSGQ
jgi:hypothetical protein